MDLLTASQLCEMLQICPRTLKRWRKKGQAPFAVRLPGGQLRYPLEDVREFLVERADETIRETPQ